MAITGYPFDGQDSTEDQYTLLFRELQDSGVADSYASSGFEVTADSTGMFVTVKPGFALLRGHAVRSTSVEVVDIGPASSSNRIDRVVLRLDPAQNSIVLAVVQGIPGASAPALTQTDTGVYELPLGKLTVRAGSGVIAPSDVADDRRFVGHHVGVWSTGTRPSSPRRGKIGFNVTRGTWEFWTGNEWGDITRSGTIYWDQIQNPPYAYTPKQHKHTWADIEGTPPSMTPGAHRHNARDIDYRPIPDPTIQTTVDDEIWRLWLQVNNNLAPRNHNHDDRYWLRSESPGSATNYNQTVRRADGTDRAHTHTPAGSGWFSVWVDGNRDFCHNTSSRRYKKNIRDYPIDPANVLALRPVAYDRKDVVDEETGKVTPGRTNEFGLIAEEVAETLPEIVQWLDKGDGEGEQIEAINYELLSVALLSVVKDQESRLARLERALEGQLAD
ncbi:tail fiber domain-containing protein [Kineococcus esterisolvens]|uniref:tail fiber domain-containing protein n=1 Tax=unclassified Kineococcus TaxID=2621656 RepID=UPI003D7DB804